MERRGWRGLIPGLTVLAENLDRPCGVAFYPPADPRYVYVALANASSDA
jgi:hypothetical protein